MIQNTCLHIPPSRLRDRRLLAERVKRGAGRSIMELAWRVCAWVRPLYLNLEPKTRKRRDEGGSTVGTLRDRHIYLIFIYLPFNQFQYKLYHITLYDFVFPTSWYFYATTTLPSVLLRREKPLRCKSKDMGHSYVASPLWLNCKGANIGIKLQRPVSQLSGDRQNLRMAAVARQGNVIQNRVL